MKEWAIRAKVGIRLAIWIPILALVAAYVEFGPPVADRRVVAFVVASIVGDNLVDLALSRSRRIARAETDPGPNGG